MTTVKDDRLQIRVDPEVKRLLEQAAASARLSVSAFVLRAASQEAESVLAERPLIVLGAEAAEAFRNALDLPGQMNKRLAAALGRDCKLRWLD
ncbi:MAG: type II toxin-antitoxin system TacA family antitoxin [Acidimicrobiales bacterium]